ncbi:KpsF/GutQ family sugar-phosphate isomerase [Hoeflea sp. WL0058]|uniref:KpsF/GutQ family sugar-phosphate isomerase n=1 Tax=Flavimaribacter sediminis TaxID=2865987 RepID=A0AAE2ZP18_9HYPH|nr:KpsF/GutQ family sugar-phosphate isomerase [Flavimaribacter sediminis]MBW8640113.1 KpsF/GutQ family sugar-phosphate isomerase [Flavimaribacter sediminis]
MPPPSDLKAEILKAAHTSLNGVTATVDMMEGPLGEAILQAMELIASKRGRVIVTGVGKSGHIGAKAAASLASTGTPALFVHATEASHGDLGMITADDCVLALSWSGETRELSDIVYHARRMDIPLIAVTSRTTSTLAKNATITLELPQVDEACPLKLAPTTSTLMQMLVCDTLAIGLLVRRGFTDRDFRHFHPGGTLGASLTLVRDAMHSGERLPVVRSGTVLIDAISVISDKGFGLTVITDENDNIRGIITDGDLRRHAHVDAKLTLVDEVMTVGGQTIQPDMLLATALKTIQDRRIGALVVEEAGKPVGILHVLDMLRIGAA